uniref:Uncharacterized protein n=1 Tax=Craspedostauros australis TaxID=1486917 RepID=A0A7R9WQ08_9STRA|mmetsp:Transcript_15469/g.42749  ORF Transcript_15469/g.42749 Transcript_15469/m.42749 type:complete len:206 (+) Transcript_15469:221-838(+)|eukprot:CAMPEP_0198113228 /NCGR_PEP_ID=MMETSP1442-20131203/4953_1 /TAXON_ID= /ORGANISM="Craspedostauros australis, Strain CCMP3328" /LENGTH=205 /DNA_ID=CAMNT_0043770269 /DNA_START=132 /DNA_END=749 /DNA_ORIENTATION=+
MDSSGADQGDGENISKISEILERAIIVASTCAAIPLFSIDRKELGIRSFAWLAAFGCSMFNHIYLNEPTKDNVEVWRNVDRLLLSMVCIPVTPHIMKMARSNQLLGYATVPPLVVVAYLSQVTPYDSELYWQIRSFLFMSIFMLPYMNHISSPPEEEEEEEPEPEVPDNPAEKGPGAPQAEAATNTSNSTSRPSSKKMRANKKKR